MYRPKYLIYIRHSIMHNKIEKHIGIRFKKQFDSRGYFADI